MSPFVDCIPRVAVSNAERAAEELSAEHLDAAVVAIREHGYVVLDNAIDTAHLDLLRERMTRESQWLLRGAAIAPSLFWSANGRRSGHLQQSVPRSGALVFRDVVCNPLANQVTSTLLGEGAFFSFPTYSCNVNCPGSEDQAVHSDPAPPGTLAVNIALRDVTEDDGAIELWPKTHDRPGDGTPIPEAVLAEQRRVLPPTRGATRKGSLLIRELSLWHRGRANRSQHLRHMIAILHYPASAPSHPYYWQKAPTVFARSAEPLFARSPLRPNVTFTDGPVPYLLTGPMLEIELAVAQSTMVGKLRRGLKRLRRLVLD